MLHQIRISNFLGLLKIQICYNLNLTLFTGSDNVHVNPTTQNIDESGVKHHNANLKPTVVS